MATVLLHRAAHPRSIKNISAAALINPAIFFDLCNLSDERSTKHTHKTRSETAQSGERRTAGQQQGYP